MTRKYKIVLGIVVVSLSYALGRYTAPVKIKTETKVVEVEKKTESKQKDISKDTHKTTTTIIERSPDGATKETTIVDEKTDYDKKTKSDTLDSKTNLSDTKKEVEKERGHTTIFAMSGIDVKNPSNGLSYGLGVNRSILGPITIGVWGMSNGIAGCSIGLEF